MEKRGWGHKLCVSGFAFFAAYWSAMKRQVIKNIHRASSPHSEERNLRFDPVLIKEKGNYLESPWQNHFGVSNHSVVGNLGLPFSGNRFLIFIFK
jgi:hypothetical protein